MNVNFKIPVKIPFLEVSGTSSHLKYTERFGMFATNVTLLHDFMHQLPIDGSHLISKVDGLIIFVSFKLLICRYLSFNYEG